MKITITKGAPRMRQLVQEQLSLSAPGIEHRHVAELEAIDRILRSQPDMPRLVLQDLEHGVSAKTGREGMTADQVLRVAIIKQLGGFSYEELSFRLPDSGTYRRFCGFGCLEPTPSRSTLQRNLKQIREETWEALNRVVLGYAERAGVEDGQKVRVDATVVESNVHPPSDSSLLWDAVRVLARLLAQAHESFQIARVPDRQRRAKRNVSTVFQQVRDFFYVTSAALGTTTGGAWAIAPAGVSPSSGLIATRAGGRATIGGPFT
jgi:IS5 family transposase